MTLNIKQIKGKYTSEKKIKKNKEKTELKEKVYDTNSGE